MSSIFVSLFVLSLTRKRLIIFYASGDTLYVGLFGGNSGSSVHIFQKIVSSSVLSSALNGVMSYKNSYSTIPTAQKSEAAVGFSPANTSGAM